MTLDTRRPRILVVDDEPVNVRLLGEVLHDMADLFVATGGARALELATLGGVDLVLLDVVMPGLDGFEVCRRLKADDRTRGIPVIFVTGLGEVADETAGFDAGGVDYITKPVSPPVVRARVRTHLELKSARDRLERMASIDGLTGLANRRRFDDGLLHEWRRATRGAVPLTVALLDVDHFKGFNDTYGHASGDDCLRAVATSLAAECRRPADIAARYGGEEFALVLPETDPDGARERLRCVLERVEDLAVPHASSPVAAHVTVSVGSITTVPLATVSPLEVVQSADRLLYDAKRGGRRRAVHMDLRAGTPHVIQVDVPGARR